VKRSQGVQRRSVANLVGESPRSSQQGCRSRRWETSAVNCPFGRLAYPMRGEATNRVLLGRKRHGRPGIQIGRRRWERPGWQQTRRLEDHRMTAAAKSTPVLKSLNGFLWNSRPWWDWGKADVTREETGKCTLSATAVGVQASEDRSAEITLGRS
jgi:hypothetical protein